MVSHHPTNKLISREPIPHQKPQKRPLSTNPHAETSEYPVLATVSGSYPKEEGRLLTCYSPVRHSPPPSKLRSSPFDLHVLSTPPAFVLSQDQTLRTKTFRNTQPTPKGQPSNPNHKTTQNKKTGIKKDKHAIEFTNNTHTPQHTPNDAHRSGDHCPFRGSHPSLALHSSLSNRGDSEPIFDCVFPAFRFRTSGATDRKITQAFLDGQVEGG